MKKDNKDLWDMLLELHSSPMWQVMSEYVKQKDISVLSSLSVLDPLKDTVLLARAQGIRTGLYALEKDIKEKIEERVAINNKIAKETEEEDSGKTRYQGY